MNNSLKLGEIQVLNRIANFYTLFYLLNTISQTFSLRTGSLKLTNLRRWKEQQKKVYSFIETSTIGYFKQKLLLNLPRIFNEEIKQLYTNKELKDTSKPSAFFINIAITLENITANFGFILMRNLNDFMVNRLIFLMFYLFEYHFYLDYHNNGKNVDFKFIIDKELIKMLDFKLWEFGFYSSRNSTKLSQITKSGMDRFIYDVTFLCFLANSVIKDQKLFVNSEEFLSKILHVYCKEAKNLTPNDFIIKREFFIEKIKKYFAEEFQADKLMLKAKIMDKSQAFTSLDQSNVVFL